MSADDVPTSVPPSLHTFFWDIEATNLDPSKHSRYVINRLLDKGDLNAARWVLRSFPKTMIVETLKTRRDFSPWNGTFWAHYLGVPTKEVACLQPSYREMRKKLWPY